MTLATATLDGRVSARVVLLKQAGAAGFVFYTNYESRKGRELAANPYAALCFFWPRLRCQVRVEGRVERLPEADSDAYFAGRERLAQLGAWASKQSQPLESPEELEQRVTELDAQAERVFASSSIPRPAHWGGYRLVAEAIEFWMPGQGRLNRRELYRRNAGGEWEYLYLNP